jgi:hypothetical protein
MRAGTQKAKERAFGMGSFAVPVMWCIPARHGASLLDCRCPAAGDMTNECCLPGRITHGLGSSPAGRLRPERLQPWKGRSGSPVARREPW